MRKQQSDTNSILVTTRLNFILVKSENSLWLVNLFLFSVKQMSVGGGGFTWQALRLFGWSLRNEHYISWNLLKCHPLQKHKRTGKDHVKEIGFNVNWVFPNTVEPQFNEVPRDWGNWFVMSRFFSIHCTANGLENIICYTEDFII